MGQLSLPGIGRMFSDLKKTCDYIVVKVFLLFLRLRALFLYTSEDNYTLFYAAPSPEYKNSLSTRDKGLIEYCLGGRCYPCRSCIHVKKLNCNFFIASSGKQCISNMLCYLCSFFKLTVVLQP
jgi:hypothetical protein